MKKLYIVLMSVLILALSLVTMANCGPGPNPSPTSTPTPTPQPTVEPFTVKPGMLCLYHWKVISESSGWLYVPDVGEVRTSSDTGGFYRYVFSAGNDSLFYYTYNIVGSYSELVNDGRLFFITTPPDFSTIKIEQADVNSNHKIITSPIGTVVTGPSTYAIVGDYIYYRHSQDPYLYFKKESLAGGNDTILLEAYLGYLADPNVGYLLNFGSLYSVGDNLYQVKTDQKSSGEEVTINQIDLSTGHIAKQGLWQFDTKGWSAPVFFTDDQALYLVTLSRNPVTSSTGESQYDISISRLTPAEFEAGQGFENIGGFYVGNGTNAPGLQMCTADEGYILLGYNYGLGTPMEYFLFDPTKPHQWTEVSIPGGPGGGQLYVARTPTPTPVPTVTTGVSPVMTSVSPISATQTQTITIQGQGFGQQSPYNGDSPYLEVSDLNGGWEAGYSVHSNAVTLNVTSWSDTQIVISGFTGSYGQMGWVLHAGDSIQIKVWNAPSLAGPATYTITIT